LQHDNDADPPVSSYSVVVIAASHRRRHALLRDAHMRAPALVTLLIANSVLLLPCGWVLVTATRRSAHAHDRRSRMRDANPPVSSHSACIIDASHRRRLPSHAMLACAAALSPIAHDRWSRMRDADPPVSSYSAYSPPQTPSYPPTRCLQLAGAAHWHLSGVQAPRQSCLKIRYCGCRPIKRPLTGSGSPAWVLQVLHVRARRTPGRELRPRLRG
jgi:hypothetical protein